MSSQQKLGPIYPPAREAKWVPAFAGMTPVGKAIPRGVPAFSRLAVLSVREMLYLGTMLPQVTSVLTV